MNSILLNDIRPDRHPITIVILFQFIGPPLVQILLIATQLIKQMVMVF